MKKFDIKWLLILVLVVVLAFGLVACNKGGDDNGGDPDVPPVPPTPATKNTPAQFFEALWNSTAALGDTIVDPSTDKIKLSLAANIDYSSKDVAAGSTILGAEMDIIVDLAALNAANPGIGDSAARIQLGDCGTDGDPDIDTNWLTLWYFFSETDFIYAKVFEEEFKINFDAYWNDTFSFNLGRILNQGLLQGTSIMDIINMIAESGKEEGWSLDDIAFDLLEIFGLDLKTILTNDTVAGVLNGLGIKIDAETASIGAIIKNPTIAGVVLDKDLVKKVTNDDGSTSWSGVVGTTIVNFANGLTDGLLKKVTIGLGFNVDAEGDIDSFQIALTSAKNQLNNAVIKINITEFDIEKINGRQATAELGKPANAKEYVDIHIDGFIDAEDDTVVLNSGNGRIGFDNYYIVFNASLDLTGAKAVNKTAAELEIKQGANGESLGRATYVNNELIVTLNTSNPNVQGFMKAALKPLLGLMKKAAVTEAELPFKIFGDLADELDAALFIAGEPNTNFGSLKISEVDIQVLAKGMFYAIFDNLAIGVDRERPFEIPTGLVTYDTTEGYKLGTKTIAEDVAQYDWSLNILNVVDTVLKAIKFNNGTYSLSISDIAATLKGIFKNTDNATKPANEKELMALFMCTNDGLIADLTDHGLLPLYKADGTTNKYISGSYSKAQAVTDGYYYMSGKMIGKTQAIAIWDFLTNDEETIEGFDAGDYVADTEYTTVADYKDNTSIGWFIKFIQGSKILGTNTTRADALAFITGAAGSGSNISLTVDKETGSIGASVTLGTRHTASTGMNFVVKGTNSAKTITPVVVDTSKDNVECVLDDDFYTLFKAAFGMGYGTSPELDLGKNNSLIYIANSATWSEDSYTSLQFAGQAFIFTSATEGYKVTSTGMDAITYSFNADGSVLTINGTQNYNVYGNALRVAVAQA